MARIPLLTGSRLTIASAPRRRRDPPAAGPGQPIADVGAAVRDAFRFPLSGEPLEALARRGGRATIVVEPPALPIPGAPTDPRRAAIAATVDELERLGIPSGYQTLLVAGGLQRRLSQRDLQTLVSPEFARRFHGHVEVHDTTSPELVDLGVAGETPLRAHPRLFETDLVVSVTAAETVLNGGPAALLGAANPEALRAAGAASLLETAGSTGWTTAVALERALARRVPVIGVSLVLNHPRLGGMLRGYPYEPEALERIAGSPLRPLFGLLPARLRQEVLRSLQVELSAATAFAGPPSVAHAEALLRGIELRSRRPRAATGRDRDRDPASDPLPPARAPESAARCVPRPRLALRLWRDAFPVVEGGTAILLSRFSRHFAHPGQQPYRAFFAATRFGREPEELAGAEQAAAADERALEAYRAGRACHPLLPFADWSACQPALQRLGQVLVAGCRDATAARQLGFVPAHGVGAALSMTQGWEDSPPRVGFLLSPPYFPLRVKA